SGLNKQDIPYIVLVNKSDLLTEEQRASLEKLKVHFISAKEQTGVEALKKTLLELVDLRSLNTEEIILTNIRHVEALKSTQASLQQVLQNIDHPVTSDFLAIEIREAIFSLGQIVGAVTTDDLLDNIFSKFCIGK